MSPAIKIAFATTVVALASASGSHAFAAGAKHDRARNATTPQRVPPGQIAGAYASVDAPKGAISFDGYNLADRQGFFYVR
jgi:hypothetical protein